MDNKAPDDEMKDAEVEKLFSEESEAPKMDNKAAKVKINDDQAENLFLDFLMRFGVNEESTEPFYFSEIDGMEYDATNTMCIDFSHVMRYNSSLQLKIFSEFLSLEPRLKKACKDFTMEQLRQPTLFTENPNMDINVGFYNLPLTKRIRDLDSSNLGELVSVRGMVTHTSEVRPELMQGTFRCNVCQTVIEVEQHLQYTKPKICTQPTCQNTKEWSLLPRRSKFVDCQRVQMQEISKDIPAGSVKRSIVVFLRHDLVEQARAGDMVIFTGVLVAMPAKLPHAYFGNSVVLHPDLFQHKNTTGRKRRKDSGVRAPSYQFAFIANSVQMCHDRSFSYIRSRRIDVDEDENLKFTAEELDDIQRMRKVPEFFNTLVESVAPAIFGHRDIKRAILLMLLGGVHKFTHEGIKLRGDINVCIVGDPACSKSQFLKYTSDLVPRSVYTSGKSSSAVGLTASVAREPGTGEFFIQFGALMLADGGICCIDEFDKMDAGDKVAIYEAMEQQTISIAKAGIHATLNARASVLAAANPIDGRYNKTKSLMYNVALPRALLSRFDLVYVMIDDPDDQIDTNIAEHIVRTHQKRELPVDPPFSTAQLKRFIMYAKTLEPEITPEARRELVASYIALRNNGTAQGSRGVFCPTVRQLEALIRLSEAIARIHLDTKVQRWHVQSATELLKTSIISVEPSKIDLSEFLEENREDSVGDTENGTGQGEDQPTGAPAESVSGNAGNGAGSSSKRRKELTITEEYFKRVTSALIMCLKQHEETVKQEGTQLVGMRQKELIAWYVRQQNEKDSYSSMEEAAAEVTKVKAIIESMIKREGYLSVISDGRQASEDSGRQSASTNDRILVLAPNLGPH